MSYLDPPDYPEPPDCCNEYMEADATGLVYSCATCGKQVSVQPDPPDDILPEYEPEPHGCAECGKPTDCVYCSTECSAKHPCQHGATPGECDACDHLSDIHYTSSKEA